MQERRHTFAEGKCVKHRAHLTDQSSTSHRHLTRWGNVKL